MSWAARLVGGLFLVAWGGALIYAGLKPDSLPGYFFIGRLSGLGPRLGRGLGFVFGPVLIAAGLAVVILG